MQTLIGNVIGFKFPSLEANQEKLERVKEDLDRLRGIDHSIGGMRWHEVDATTVETTTETETETEAESEESEPHTQVVDKIKEAASDVTEKSSRQKRLESLLDRTKKEKVKEPENQTQFDQTIVKSERVTLQPEAEEFIEAMDQKNDDQLAPQYSTMGDKIELIG